MFMKHHRARRVISRSMILFATAVFVASVTSCASLEPGEALQPSDEMLEGPGLFSGNDGEFSIIDLKKDRADEQVNKGGDAQAASRDIAKEDLQGTSDILDEKLIELEQQKQELEALKREVKKKIEEN